MKKMLVIFTVAIAFIGFALAGADAAVSKKAKKQKAPVIVSTELKDEEVLAKFKETFKNVKSVESVSKTPVAGIYEIVGNGGSAVFYYAPKSDILFFGDMVNKEMKSLTQEKRNSIQQAKLGDIPLDKAIKIGNGQHKVIEFTDPDCPYCRQAASYFKDKDVTKYVFLRPIPALHPKAEEKCRYILDAPDKAKAYYEAMSGALESTTMFLLLGSLITMSGRRRPSSWLAVSCSRKSQ